MSALADTVFVLTLLWTNPATKASLEVIPPAERAVQSDSLAPSCLPSNQSLTDLDSVIAWGYPLTGGGFRRVGSQSVRSREGLPDSMTLSIPGIAWSRGGRFYVTFKRTGPEARESCESNIVTKVPPLVTGVEPGRTRVVVEEWFDVQGRRLKGPTGTGIRWVRWSVAGRFIGSQRVVVLKGRVMSPLRRPSP